MSAGIILTFDALASITLHQKFYSFLQGQAPETDVEHVMLSYHPDQREIMLRISERLKEKGYKVWLAKSNSQSYPEHFMEAIENAALVLVGISRKYKQTPSIFAGKRSLKVVPRCSAR